MKKRNSNKFLRKLGLRLIAAALVLVGLVVLVDLRIRPIIEKTSSYQSRILATRIINQAVYDEVNSELFDYSKLVTVTFGNDGRVTSIESNMMNINKLKTLVTQNINEEIKGIEDHDLGISLGTISGIHLFYGKGPSIPFHVAPKGYVNTQLISEFSEAGINQTLHRILLEVSVDVSAIIPGYTTSVDVTTNFVVAETVIVGSIPDSYTHVITGDSDLIGRINDYAAR